MSEAWEVFPDTITNVTQAHDAIVRALYEGFSADVALDAVTSQEKLMAVALHYGDTLAPHKPLLKQAYEAILCSPQNWPAGHAWIMAEKWLEATELQKDFLQSYWRRTVLLGIAHRIAMSWFDSENDDTWLQSIDTTITGAWPFINIRY